ncbi:hypothetical protein BJN34_17050 [Cupriavidus necator]|uniref:SGNH hydrolase-type esterase domain-containing protein n=2 Tax=Cupriavidus necator TaxID=106590 RepID=A0A1U9USJ0_CUPNE|nr:hypothetical protein BJN34_17050 [Cupriavidus necator]
MPGSAERPNRLKPVQSFDMMREGAPILGDFDLQCLAQGDSWFSINTLRPFSGSNLLMNMWLSRSAIAVDCADPGDTLAHMLDSRQDPLFYSFLVGPHDQAWSVILLSGGGNDLIDAIQTTPNDANGHRRPPNDRLLLTDDEWDGPDAISTFISRPGWIAFTRYMLDQYRALDFLRRISAQNQNTPIVTHTYDYATPRDSGAGLGRGPWLFPAMQVYGIPEDRWIALAHDFTDRLADDVILQAGIPNFHVADTRGTLDPAGTEDHGATADWENEIHPTAEGYGKLGVKFVDKIAAVLGIP